MLQSVKTAKIVFFSLIASLYKLIYYSVVAVGVLWMLTGGKSQWVASLFTLNVTLLHILFLPLLDILNTFSTVLMLLM